jgi:hypothetical protein
MVLCNNGPMGVEWNLQPVYFIGLLNLQRGPKVTSLVARSTRGRCAQHLRRIRGCDHASGEILAHDYVTQMLCAEFGYMFDVRHSPRIMQYCAQQGMLLLDPSV